VPGGSRAVPADPPSRPTRRAWIAAIAVLVGWLPRRCSWPFATTHLTRVLVFALFAVSLDLLSG